MGASWRDYVNCGDMDPEVFFTANVSSADRQEALQACNSCLVRAQCLQVALDHGEEFGIWGGLNPAQRMRLSEFNRTERRASNRAPKEHGSHGAIKRHHRDGTDLCPKCIQFERETNAARYAARKAARTEQEIAS
jgi:WhiB family transcriptional regulator, redox-sensing transcriptional regulator